MRLADRDDPINQFIAAQIIELAKAGERPPDLLCDRVLEQLRRASPPLRQVG